MVFESDVVLRNATVYTLDPARPWASTLAVWDSRIVGVGDEADAARWIGPHTRVVDCDGALVMPGLVDAHAHVGFGGQQARWELSLSPMMTVPQILEAVRARARELDPLQWVVGGPIISPVFHTMGNQQMLAALDEASLGRPVMLRDDSLHNRWVNSRALEILAVVADTPDPFGGSYARDADGRLVGQLLGRTSTEAELAARRDSGDVHARDLESALTAVSLFNSVGVTAVQDAATMGAWLDVFGELDRADSLNTWLVASLPAREFIESGPVGLDLFETASARRTTHVRPDFVKVLLDGVPMTRTSRFLQPYKPAQQPGDPAGDPDAAFHGVGLFSDDELLKLLDRAVAHGLHAKLHATADATVRQALDTVALIRERHGAAAIFHAAHPEFVHPDDIARFPELDVVADLSPVLWFPNPINDIIALQVQDQYLDRIWPLRELHDAGALLAAGSDWPVAMAEPNPWLSIQTMVTRRSPDPTDDRVLGADQALELVDAVKAHTVNAAAAIGLGDEIGRLTVGRSADFIVLDHNIFEIPVEQIAATTVRQTWFAGRLVHGSTDR